MKITYPVVVDWEADSHTWDGDPKVALEAAIDALDAEKMLDGRWAYLADETGEWYALTADEMRQYGAAVLNGEQTECYSIWCAETGKLIDNPTDDQAR